MGRLVFLKDKDLAEQDFYSVSGYFVNLDPDTVLSDIELGFRVTRAIESELEGFGPLFDALYEEYIANGDDDKITEELRFDSFLGF